MRRVKSFNSASSIFGQARRRAAAFRRDEGGSLILFGLMIFILMLWSLGMAVDVMRVETQRTLLQNTLDRAVLAAADLDQTEDAKEIVQDYFQKAGLSRYLDNNSIAVNTSTAAGQLSFRRVTASASATVDSMFLQMLGIDQMVAASASTAEEGITDLEISLVLDVSGSMGWSSSSGNSKIYELREAAKDFSYYMQCNPNAARGSGTACSVEPGKVSITIVPYAEQVTVGPLLLNEFNVSAEHLYSDCVTFDTADFQTVIIDPNVELKRTGAHDPWGSGTYASDSRRTCRTDSWRQIRPFIEDYNETISRINGLSAGGNTSIDVAMKWGATFLDPSVRDIITTMTTTDRGDGNPVVDPVFAGRPYSYTQDYSMKVVVLMTDGVNTDQHYLKDPYRSGPSPIYRNTYYSDRFSIYNAATGKYYYTHDGKWYDQPYGDIDGEAVTTTNTYCRWTWWYGYRCWTETTTSVVNQPGSAVQMTYPEVWERFTTDWYAGWSWLENPVLEYKNAEKNSRLSAICGASKDEGVIVYSIGFEVTTASAQVMSDCASTPGHYFDADGTNLADVFGVIASSINQLRLTQ